MSGEAPVPDPLADDAYRGLFRDAGTDAPKSEPQPETGRLFRTYRAETATEAIVALRPEQARKLRSLTTQEAGDAEPATPLVVEQVDEVVDEPVTKRRAPGLRPGAVYVIDIVLTVLVAFVEVLVRGDVGWITGVALLVAATYTGWVVRLSDWPVTVIAPPIAFFIAAITAGQLGLGQAGESLLNRGAQVFFILGTNWMWILGAVAVAFVLSSIRLRMRP